MKSDTFDSHLCDNFYIHKFASTKIVVWSEIVCLSEKAFTRLWLNIIVILQQFQKKTW